MTRRGDHKEWKLSIHIWDHLFIHSTFIYLFICLFILSTLECLEIRCIIYYYYFFSFTLGWGPKHTPNKVLAHLDKTSLRVFFLNTNYKSMKDIKSCGNGNSWRKFSKACERYPQAYSPHCKAQDALHNCFGMHPPRFLELEGHGRPVSNSLQKKGYTWKK